MYIGNSYKDLPLQTAPDLNLILSTFADRRVGYIDVGANSQTYLNAASHSPELAPVR
jgi:hypothetical protein